MGNTSEPKCESSLFHQEIYINSIGAGSRKETVSEEYEYRRNSLNRPGRGGGGKILEKMLCPRWLGQCCQKIKGK